jgi:microcystin-dependent protein
VSEPFLGEIKILSFNFPPKGWAFCNGQFLPINQNQALFSLFGTMYGGNGQTTFALPNLQGRVPISQGGGHTQGEAGGTTTVTINQQTMPTHIHALMASSAAANNALPGSNILAQAPQQVYAAGTNLTPMNATSVTNVGGSQAHDNMMPYLVLNFCVALQGIFPSRN